MCELGQRRVSTAAAGRMTAPDDGAVSSRRVPPPEGAIAPWGGRPGRDLLIIPTLLLLAVLPVTAQPLFESDYIHSIYNAAAPGTSRSYSGHLSHDLSDIKWWRQLYGEMGALGINHTAPLVTYGLRAIYPTQIPELHQDEEWAAYGMDPLRTLLDVSAEAGIEVYPAVWLFRDASPELAERVIRELIAMYGDHPAFAGIVPSVEANPTYAITSLDFIDLSRIARGIRPGTGVMDYPNGPFSPTIIQTIMDRSQSGQVDVQNVQFHPSDRRWDSSFAFARGLTHFVMGLAPGIRSIVHTHYKYGGGLRWIQNDDLYRVHQAATLTATPDGTSIFLFGNAMYGRTASYNLDDPMPRRLAWYSGILGVQRMVPWLDDAQPANAVAVMIPRYTREQSLLTIERAWLPLAKAHIGAHFFVDEQNIGGRTQAIVVRGLQWCSPEQLRLIESFVAEGGAVFAWFTPEPPEAAPVDERTRQVVGATYERGWQPSGVGEAFAKAIGLDDATGAITDPQPREVAWGEGTIYLAPIETAVPEADATEAPLVEWIAAHSPDRALFGGLGEHFVADTWQCSEATNGARMAMIMGTTAGAEDERVVVDLPSDFAAPRAWLLKPDSVQPLPVRPLEGRAEVRVPLASDEFNAVIIADSTLPFLIPARRLVRCRTGEPATVHFGLLNAFDRPLQGTIEISAPEGWAQPEPASIPVDLQVGSAADLACTLTVPEDAVQAPHFVRIEMAGLVQRVMLYPEDGPPQRFTDTPEAELAEAERTRAVLPAPQPRPTIGEEWLVLMADDPQADNPAAHSPGICLLPGPEWDEAAEHDGLPARYGARMPRVGGPNFLINDPPATDLEVRLTYQSEGEGTVEVYDGANYHLAAEMPPADEWSTLTARVPREILMTPGVDRSQHPGLNVMGAISADRIWLHSLEVRLAPAEEQ